jgi:peptidoglycan hydrolase CwlO-like protein
VIQIVSSLCQRVADAERKTAMMQAKYKRKRRSLTRLNAECRNLIGSLREKKGVLENELQKQETEEERSVMKKVAELERLLEAKRAQEQTLGRTRRGERGDLPQRKVHEYSDSEAEAILERLGKAL